MTATWMYPKWLDALWCDYCERPAQYKGAFGKLEGMVVKTRLLCQGCLDNVTWARSIGEPARRQSEPIAVEAWEFDEYQTVNVTEFTRSL